MLAIMSKIDCEIIWWPIDIDSVTIHIYCRPICSCPTAIDQPYLCLLSRQNLMPLLREALTNLYKTLVEGWGFRELISAVTTMR